MLFRSDEAVKDNPELTAIRSDVSQPDDVRALFAKVKSMGGIDILYNNAGISTELQSIGNGSGILENASNEMEINYLGVIRINSIFLEMLQSREEAAIINTSSILSVVPSMLEPTYSASKAALSVYTKMLREHLNASGSRLKVFELLPPLVETGMTSHRDGRKITPRQLVGSLIDGLKKDRTTIRVGDTRTVYILNRLFPRLAFRLVNPKRVYELVRKVGTGV